MSIKLAHQTSLVDHVTHHSHFDPKEGDKPNTEEMVINIGEVDDAPSGVSTEILQKEGEGDSEAPQFLEPHAPIRRKKTQRLKNIKHRVAWGTFKMRGFLKDALQGEESWSEMNFF